VNDIHPEKDLPDIINQINEQIEGKITLAINIPVLRKNGKIVYCDVNSNPGKFNGQEGLVGFFRDITNQKKQNTS
jgi:PAS domain S-box-containing protein